MSLDIKFIYRQLCDTESTVPIFSQYWWLDAIATPSNWDVAIVERNGFIKATMPYVIRKGLFGMVLVQPPLTQTLGPWFRPSTAKYTNRLGEEKELMTALIAQLPTFARFKQNWHYSQINWLPFYWAGFQQTTRYTYILTDLSGEKAIWNGFRESIRTDIRKASERFALRVRDDLGIEVFLPLNRMTFSRQGYRLPYTEDLVYRLDAACRARDCRKIWVAEDAQGRRHAGIYIVWDENSAYYLMGGSDPNLRNSGATSLCMWEAIKHAATVTRQFDFEGSMIESVERFFRAFGAIQTPYYQVTKTPSRLLRAGLCITQLLRGQ